MLSEFGVVRGLEPAEQDNADIIGKEIIIDNRRYLIESVGKISGDVSMRDITFKDSIGFPINRVEKIDYIRSLLEQERPELPPEEKDEKPLAPSAVRHNYRITEDTLGVGGAKEKLHNCFHHIRINKNLVLHNCQL